MAQFDVYPNPGGAGWLVDVQTDLLQGLNTRAVVPLLKFDDAPAPARRLNPVFEIAGEKTVMTTQFLAAVPLAILKTPLTNLSARHDEIAGALDLLFHGF